MKKASVQTQGEPPFVVLRKYANRRLYDPSRSDYVTIASVIEQIRSGTRVVVTDRDETTDLTKQVLLLALTELERAGQGVISSDALHDLIRSGTSR